jgi:mono/diheme cytochrome c family protein
MRFLRDAVITVVLPVVVAAIVGYFGARGGLSAETSPGPVERAVATRLPRLAIPSDARNAKNPFPDTLTWRDAADHFDDHCAVCHGDDGRGATEVGRNMYPKVPDLGSVAIQQMTDGDLFYVIQNGVGWTGVPG